MGFFGDVFSGGATKVFGGGGGSKQKPSARQMLRQQTTRAKSLGKKVQRAEPGGKRAAKLGKLQNRLSGRMERTYGQMQSRREKRGMKPARQIGTARQTRRARRAGR
jgi:hypothetical protein